MKKEWLLALVSGAVTLACALGLIRWFAPQLLGVPVDLQMVRVAKEVPPFFDNVFRHADLTSKSYILPDPVIRRAKPLTPDEIGTGPNDVLGFRNRHIPTVADVIAIGDSQTYGNNAPLELNWPGHLQRQLGTSREVYGMAVGAWGAVQYLEIFSKALYLQPRVVIVAFYTGNDPLDSFATAYADDRWLHLRPDARLRAGDVPDVAFPPPPADLWQARFPDGFHTIFTPKLRRASNQPHPAVRAGYEIMARSGKQMGELAAIARAQLVLTIIPTKELVYAEKIRQAGIAAPEEFQSLIEAERAYIDELSARLQKVSGAHYVDLLGPLRQAALAGEPLYGHDSDGHPQAAGYAVIGKALADVVAPVLPAPLDGLVMVRTADGQLMPHFIRGGRQWAFRDQDALLAAGWDPDAQYPEVRPRDIANIPYGAPSDFAAASAKGLR